MQYKTITSYGQNPQNEFELLVQQAIVYGWTPIGGIAVTRDTRGLQEWIQAMTKDG